MSCLSRLLGLICAVVPGLLFLALSVMLVPRWAELGYVTGPFYSLVTLITGAVCLYLGVALLLGRDDEKSAPALDSTPQIPVAPAPVQLEPVTIVEPEPAREMVAAPLPVPPPAPVQPEPVTVVEPEPAPPLLAKPEVAPPVDTPAQRIRQLAATRPGWQVTAPQLAQLTNLNMNVADAAAREMVEQGEAQLQIGPNGETIYIFNPAQ